jgi:hypothetical protein
MALWAWTAAATASLARRKATKNESPWVSISRPPNSSKAPLLIGQSVPVAIPQLLDQPRRPFDVREKEGDGAAWKLDY